MTGSLHFIFIVWFYASTMNTTKRLVSILFIAMSAVACSPSGEVSDSQPPTVRLVTSDGVEVTMVVSGCESRGERTLKFVAQTEEDENPIVLSLDATGGEGTIILSGDEEREGTVDQLMVSDTGQITASGALNAADDSAPGGDTFELTGSCG